MLEIVKRWWELDKEYACVTVPTLFVIRRDDGSLAESVRR